MKKTFLYSLIIFSFLTAESYTIKKSSLDSYISQIPLRDKAGQLFIVCTPPNRHYSTAPGGIIPTKELLRNVFYSDYSVNRLFDAPFIPPFVAVDQEGGKVNRLSFASKFPSAGELASMGTDKSSPVIDDQLRIMKKCGINLNLSPVVDISSDSASHIFRTGRMISSDPDSTVSFAQFYMERHRKMRILTAIKHFPGYGDTYDNSDRYLTKFKGGYSLFLKGFSVFSRLIPESDFVMVSNLIYPFLDTLPAMMSPSIIKYIGEYNDRAVVLTDDIACSSHADIFKDFKLSLKAGCDMFILMNDTLYESMCDSVLYWINSGDYSEDMLDNTLEKVILKKEYLFRIISDSN